MTPIMLFILCLADIATVDIGEGGRVVVSPAIVELLPQYLTEIALGAVTRLPTA